MWLHRRPSQDTAGYFCLSLLVALLAAPLGSWGSAQAAGLGDGRGVMMIDFEEGTAPLQSYEGEDFEPDAWEIQSENTFNGTNYALRMWGNTWKELLIEPYPLTPESIFQAAIFSEQLGELQAFAFGDASDNVLFYDVSGEQLVLSDRWNVVYKGAFPQEEWRAYLLPVGRDWYDTWGYVPEITRLIFVNDHDETSDGITLFDEVYDVTEDMPIAPIVEIQIIVGAVDELPPSHESGGETLYRMEVTFLALVYDPDSIDHTFHWDFGDGTTSDEENPTHNFTATANYTFTVSLDVTDDTGLFGRDTCQVSVEPSGQSGVGSINFTGDIFMGRAYEQPGGLIETYGVEYLFEWTLGILGEAADVTLVNCENAFTDQGEPHPTKSVVFRTSPENIQGLVFAGVDIISLGNNHIVDYGLEGLLQTHEVVDSVGIVRGGSGINEYFAIQPCYYTQDGVRLAFINFCNRTGREYNYQPFLDAGYDKCGFGYWNRPNMERSIAQADSLADIVVAFPHSGLEYQTAPEPEAGSSGPAVGIESPDPENWTPPVDYIDPELCPPHVPIEEAADVRFRIWPGMTDRELRWHAVDIGADAVLNAHPHVLQGFEVYEGVLIAHSLGNFMFDLYYPETMPTIVLRALFDKEGIQRWTFKPAFIDRYVPKPAHGRLGREILDRMADYSRVLGACVGVNPEIMTGIVFLDPGSATPVVTASQGTQAFVEEDDYYVSIPIELVGEGNLSRIIEITGVPPQDCEICWGREMLWFGRFEQDEGYHMWNLNSSDEWLDDLVFKEGAHSLVLHREHNAGDNVITMLSAHLRAEGSVRYNINGWMKTENANDAKFSVRCYHSRYTWNPIFAVDMGDSVNGTTDWTWYCQDFLSPEEADFFNVRCNLDVPESGDAYAWFDDLRVIEWLPWEPLEIPMEIPYPNNFRFLQVKVPYHVDSVTLSYEETALTDGGFQGVYRPDQPSHVRATLRGASPNPFRDGTKIRYRLSASAQVSLEVFDVNGRLVDQLADNERKRPGWHKVSWEAPGRPTGIYFARLTVDGQSYSRKMVLLK
ncbi:MAG: CapA family protein [Candidatus Eisenbacteria sp.]|nr:CapA family protein [Candidatus Eisenbacteria bacterium]